MIDRENELLRNNHQKPIQNKNKIFILKAEKKFFYLNIVGLCNLRFIMKALNLSLELVMLTELTQSVYINGKCKS